MLAAVSAHEESQLSQTIEMFEVITQTQPLDYQSLEILKEAYLKLGRTTEALGTSKRIASAYVQLGQLSSAILEYESILQAHPEDPDVKAALTEIEHRATNFPLPRLTTEPEPADKPHQRTGSGRNGDGKAAPTEIDDGRAAMRKIFVEGKHVSAAGFDSCWPQPNPGHPAGQVAEPFIQTLAHQHRIQLEISLKVICERARISYLPIDMYDVDVELARTFPKELCQRWCILPFDRMSKSVLVATANPFNKQAAREAEKFTKGHLIWYMASPQELVRTIRKIFR